MGVKRGWSGGLSKLHWMVGIKGLKDLKCVANQVCKKKEVIMKRVEAIMKTKYCIKKFSRSGVAGTQAKKSVWVCTLNSGLGKQEYVVQGGVGLA